MAVRYSRWDFGLDRDYARISLRATAALLDLGLVAGPCVALFVWLDSMDQHTGPARADVFFASWLLFELLWCLYSSLLHASSWQATLGKRLFKLKVTDRQGKRLRPLRALWRTLMWHVGVLTLGLAFLTALFTRKRTGLHDTLAGTLVVRANGLL